MPAYFIPSTPMQVVDFDYEAFFNSFKNRFEHLYFYPEWKNYWLKIFHETENEVLDYVRRFPNSNPVLQRLKHGVAPDAYEMYVFEHVTEVGSFYLHFDVEKMKNFQRNASLTKETLSIDELYVDPTTPLNKEQEKDTRMPFFIRMYGTPQPYICVDGNKRIKARIANGQEKFEGYIFEDKDVVDMFFGSPDQYYYIFLRECEFMVKTQILEESTQKDIFQTTQMYLQGKG
ncbi:hypothetical protein [Halobacillus sp. B23F22_1]|uniref:hypothetical protein n=1 Tax=Halobacillus sp. B23F22_1 TaxID=3459514 RepID=UPI00373E6604